MGGPWQVELGEQERNKVGEKGKLVGVCPGPPLWQGPR